ncbi:type I restriction enzyme M protein [Actinomadura pelletieri DSM 43383]|uniref:site-specific DNA-methyltransferase (adenine-specific) n=1 Tax=Actinomadura pelletieri DSM 43383 TaxID=1120940 RepID=A0A495QUH5_9ACTN|nr:class I SAM-dependent DNA methyltransferase [Actinomadura pelletieri]RKS77098.1 type I restriction enzyme M protein [Actinomadura pelletieri DSM 43383]
MNPEPDLKEILWKAADKLRGSVDAAHYRDFVLGLVFLKYVSDASGEGAFRVPEGARWTDLAAGSGAETIGMRVDAAMDAVMRANPPLSGVLPRLFGRDEVDQRRLGELVALIGDVRFGGDDRRSARDVLGEVYEYFLERFARAEGKRGGEFYTPSSVVKVLVEILEPFRGRVYDPCCGSGGMFVQAEKFVLSHRGRLDDIAVHGQEANERTWRLAKMNLAVHGITGDLAGRWADTFYEDAHPTLQADFVLANPPFNVSDWYRDENDPRWRFGVPPAGNANFAWMQHIVAKLGPTGVAGVVMANGSMSSRQSAERAIRAALVEADLVSCVVALPGQLFRSTQIPACLWILDKGKALRNQVLFIDARAMGTMIDRRERVLSDTDVGAIAGAYRSWRDRAYSDVPGFCYSAGLDEIRTHDHVLTPGRYVGAAETDPGEEPAADRAERLTKELFAQFEESAHLDQVVRAELGRLNG